MIGVVIPERELHSAGGRYAIRGEARSPVRSKNFARICLSQNGDQIPGVGISADISHLSSKPSIFTFTP